MKRAGQVLGVFTVAYLVLHRFGEDELRVLNLLANQASIAIDNALAYQKLQAALAERERTQQALIRSESLAAVGQLVAGVAHELNNPLASVSSLIQSALETIGLPYAPVSDSAAALPVIRPGSIKPLAGEDLIEIADDLAFSLKELRRAKSIVSSLLDLSRQSQSYTEEVELDGGVPGCAAYFAQPLEESCRLKSSRIIRKTCLKCAATLPTWGRWP